MRRLLLYALLIPLLISCGTGGEQRCIVAADSLMENNPDSAYKLLRSEYGQSESFSRGTRMRYLLTYAEAMNKAYVPMDTVKFMDDVLDYYNSHGSATEKMAANYMMGCVYRDGGNSPEAIRYFEDAVAAADTANEQCDYLLLSRIYGQIASIYMEQRYATKEQEAWRKGRHYALMAKDTLSAIQYLEKSGHVYLLRGNDRLFIASVDSANHDYLRYGYPQYAATCQIHKAKFFLETGNIDAAGKALRIFRKESGLFNADGSIQSGREFYYYYEGRYLEETGDFKAALQSFYQLLQYRGDIQNIENGYKGLMETYGKLGYADSLLKYSKLYAQANDSANIKNSASELIRMQSLYNYNESQQELIESTKESRNLWRALFCFFIVVLILSSLIFFYFKNRKKDMERLKENYNHTMALLRKAEAELDDMQSDSEKFKKQKQSEIEQLRRQLSSYSENFRLHDWASEQSALHHGTVEHLRGLAGRGVAMSASEWTDFEGTMKKLMSEFYVKIEHSKAQLTDQEFKVCLLTRMKFSSSDISNLLGTSQQRVTNIKSSINEKLFHKKGSKSLLANLSLM